MLSNPLTPIFFKAQLRTTSSASGDIYWNSLPQVVKKVSNPGGNGIVSTTPKYRTRQYRDNKNQPHRL
ncbi:hypothetical protein SCLCIDRAFT_1216936 [Scleroderma citrinum Foug A]|uniref:Uncharacterized protein n=1 Tax=Scleroderma citrinum Foug A TaxID=1036808 RepID=A0A0C3DHY9_9AGAM|nr:hypothetical protein SCLCIDRAFT_1216936 [Scleroderma citrinum Foug A]